MASELLARTTNYELPTKTNEVNRYHQPTTINHQLTPNYFPIDN
ncbi:MAG: hypothetical protein VKN72_08680 [Nostocales cyanobacterium 94392]|nr:hypothetical protein [Nostocales cyanobacterium 94392]